MAYVQFSLLGIPAIVIEGNALTLEQHATWYTPMHMMGAWPLKLRRREAPEPAIELPGQATFF